MRRVTWPGVGARNNHIFGIPDPDLSIHYKTFRGPGDDYKPLHYKAFWLKFCRQKGSENSCFWEFRRGKFLTLKFNPHWRSIPTGTRRLKLWRYSKKMFSRAAQEITKNKNKDKHLHMIFHPVAGGVFGRLLYFCMLGGAHDVITRTKF